MEYKRFIKQAGCALVCVTMLAACSDNEGTNTNSTSSELASSASAGASNSSEAKTASLDYVDQMDKTKIMSFSINVDEAKWKEMLEKASEEEYISADVTINGTTIKNVGIRPKGNSSLMKVVQNDKTDRFSFKIKFDEYVDGQTWLGLDQIVINNMDADNSYLKEYLSYDIMSSIGVDAPLYAFADISVNGKAWGFYLAVEVLDSAYLDRTQEGEGELYKPNNDNGMMGMGGGNFKAPNGEGMPEMPNGEDMPMPDMENMPEMPADMQPPAEGDVNGGRGAGGFGGRGGMNGAGNGVSLVYSDDKIESYSAIFDNAETKTTEEDHERVITALKNLNAGTDLEKYVDVDAVLKYFAAHTVVVNMDSYTANMAHNYYLYENEGQLSILPWDYNLAFGGFMSGNASDVVNQAIDTPVSGVTLEERPLLGKLLEVPENKEQYHKYLQEIVDNYFANGKFEQTVSNLNQLISEHVKNDPTSFTTFDAYTKAVAELTKLGKLRAESIQGQLDGTIPSTTEGQKADKSKLIDASSVDLTKIGNMGRGMGGGMGERPAGTDSGAKSQQAQSDQKQTDKQ